MTMTRTEKASHGRQMANAAKYGVTSIKPKSPKEMDRLAAQGRVTFTGAEYRELYMGRGNSDGDRAGWASDRRGRRSRTRRG